MGESPKLWKHHEVPQPTGFPPTRWANAPMLQSFFQLHQEAAEVSYVMAKMHHELQDFDVALQLAQVGRLLVTFEKGM